MRLLWIILSSLMLVGASMPAWSGPAGIEQFLASRDVVTSVYFPYGSSSLANSTKKEIDQHIDKLIAAVSNGFMLRVEGFSSPEGRKTDNFRLSLHRAHSVSQYLTTKGLSAKVEVTGFGNLKSGSQSPNLERRVDIALYRETIDLTPLKAQTKEGN